jgi:hypothetical protein
MAARANISRRGTAGFWHSFFAIAASEESGAVRIFSLRKEKSAFSSSGYCAILILCL